MSSRTLKSCVKDNEGNNSINNNDHGDNTCMLTQMTIIITVVITITNKDTKIPGSGSLLVKKKKTNKLINAAKSLPPWRR